MSKSPYPYRPAPAAPLIVQYELCVVNGYSSHSLFTIRYTTELVTFSAKEKDPETGRGVTSLRSVSSLRLGQVRTSSSYPRSLRQFGARYYSSDLSIWLSVDPMSDKYPSMSPYMYCAGNPIKLVDPNGRDYETVVDEANKTITIKATYYTANENKEKLQEGLDVWNSQSGKYSFEIGKGKDKQSYTINLELTMAEGDFETTLDASTAMPLDGTTNLFECKSDLDGKANRGIAEGGKHIQVLPQVSGRTVSHEIGHTIGIGEFNGGLMESGGNGISISLNNIASSLNGAGIISIGVSTGVNEIKTTSAKSTLQYQMLGNIKKTR